MTEADFQVFDKIGAPVFVLDRDGRIIHWNRTCSELSGYAFDEVRGRHIRDFLGPEVKSLAQDDEFPRRFESYWVTRSGERRWLAWFNTFTVGPDGQVEYIVGTGVDRTADKQAEELRLSEARLREIVSVAADAIITIDEEQRIVIYNQGAEEIFGWRRDEVLGKPLDILLPERVRRYHREHLRSFAVGTEKARRMGERSSTIFGLRKNGEEFPAEAAISKLDFNGAVLFTVVLRDVTERKRTEMDQRFLADIGTALISSLNLDEMIERVARLVVRELADACIVDLVEAEGEERPCKVIHRDPARSPACDRFRQVLLDRRAPRFVWPVVETGQPILIGSVGTDDLESFARGGEHLRAFRELDPRSLMALPLRARGKLLGAIVLLSSHPFRTYGPQDLRLAQELTHRAALAIDNARLYQEAQRAIRAREDVLSIVAHDLRNPIHASRLAAAVLRQQLPEERTEKARKSVETIVRSSERATRLIQDLLDVARIDAGRLSVEHDCVPAGPMVLEAVNSQQLMASSSSLELRFDLRGELPEIRADRHRLLQVFENLIGNAVKFTSPGGQITVGAAARGQEVLFWVADTGAGILAESLPHVFERFYQTGKADRRGAGLGLPIVKGIVEAHRGRVWAESIPGRGSTFYFTLPVAEAVEDRASETAHLPG